MALVLLGNALLGDWLGAAFFELSAEGGFVKTYHDQIGMTVSGAIAVPIYMLFILNKNLLRNNKKIRRNFLIPNPAKFEGYWGSISRRNLIDEASEHEILTSISKIYFSKSERLWVHHGFEFNKSGSCIGEFKVKSLHFSRKRGDWFFEGTTAKHEAGTSELYSEQYEAKHQLSFISLAPKMRDHIVSRFFDDPISAGKWPQASGRAAMTRIEFSDMRGWFGEFCGVIEHPTIRSSMPDNIEAIRNYLALKTGAATLPGQPAESAPEDNHSVEQRTD